MLLDNKGYATSRFLIPPNFNFDFLPIKSNRVTVFTLIGDSNINEGKRLTEYIKNVPQNITSRELEDSDIEGFYDVENQRIYLFYERKVSSLSTLKNIEGKNLSEINDYFDSNEFQHFKNLYFLFSVSHFVISFHQGLALDTEFINILCKVTHLRNLLSSKTENQLRSVIASREYFSGGWLFRPKLLFVFRPRSNLCLRNLCRKPNAVENLQKNLAISIAQCIRSSQILTDEKDKDLFTLDGINFVHVEMPGYLESQNGSVKTISSDSAQFLFDALLTKTPLDQFKPLQPISPFRESVPDGTSSNISFENFVNMHFHSFFAVHQRSADSSSPLPNVKVWFIAVSKFHMSLWNSSRLPNPVTRKDDDTSYQEKEHIFQLKDALENLHCPIQRNKIGSFQEKNWLNSNQHSLLHPLGALSLCLGQIRLKDALAAAEAHYKDGLPLHYSKTYHLMKIVSSFTVLINLARGPQIYSAMSYLVRRLTRLYLAGRLLCSCKSILGHQCVLEMHRSPQSVETAAHNFEVEFKAIMEGLAVDVYGYRCRTVDAPEALQGAWRMPWLKSAIALVSLQSPACFENLDKSPKNEPTSPKAVDFQKHQLAVYPHSTQNSMISACNCGKTISQRPEPFDYKQANWEFYAKLHAICCYKLNQIHVAPNYLTRISSHPYVLEPTEKPLIEGEIKKKALYACPLNTSQSFKSSSSSEKSSTASSITSDSLDDLNLLVSQKRKLSNTEVDQPSNLSIQQPLQPIFYHGVPTLDQTPEQLPLYSSWSIMSIGKYSIYSHSNGIRQSGFFPETNYLLPWNFYLNDVSKLLTWKGKRDSTREICEMVKIFLGFEMECPLGHRFFLAAPGEPMSGLMNRDKIRASVNRLLEENIPLYTVCKCQNDISEKNNKIFAQLIRIFINVPLAPIRIKFSPTVRPGPLNKVPIFHLGPTTDQWRDNSKVYDSNEEKPYLHPGYVYLDAGNLWVIRLPYAYQNSENIFIRPETKSEAMKHVLLSGSIEVLEL